MVFKKVCVIALLSCFVFSCAMEKDSKKDHPPVGEEDIRGKLADLKADQAKKGTPKPQENQPRLGSVESLKNYFDTLKSKL